jgi:replicative DNA helicase
VAFSSRATKWQKGSGPKYINTPETPIYQKRKTLFALDVALREAKNFGIYIVEGQGDVAAAHAANLLNIAATCGTALTADHLDTLRALGINQMYLAFDWDEAGQQATERVLREELKNGLGISCWVIPQPSTGEKDVGEYLLTHSADEFRTLPKVSAFEWLANRMATTLEPVDLCTQLIPIIAIEPTAVRRDALTQTLAKMTGVLFESIQTDVNNLRDHKFEERKQRLMAVAHRFQNEVQSDPDSILALIAQAESDVAAIESDYKRDLIGVNYQLNRYQAEQERRKRDAMSGAGTGFKLSRFSYLSEALSGGATWSDSILAYVGGRANSGKTAFVISLAVDAALSDKDAIVITHFTDDNYSQVEPRIKSNIAEFIRDFSQPPLEYAKVANPWLSIKNSRDWDLYYRAEKTLKSLLEEERLIIIDSEDGKTLTALEKHIRYARQRYPDKRILVVCDNTHNYRDFPHYEATQRMTEISDYQKTLAGKYRCAIFATVEYVKETKRDQKKMRLPVDDDIADARALIYRPNLIMHVYNDLNDRGEFAEILWHRPGIPEPQPRILINITKNKITKFKQKLVFDLDTDTITFSQYDTEEARSESAARANEIKGQGRVKDGALIVETEYDD